MRFVRQAACMNDEATALVWSGRLSDATRILQRAFDRLWLSTHNSERDKVLPALPPLNLDSTETDQTQIFDEYGGYNYEGMMFIHDEPLSFSDAVDNSQQEHDTVVYRTACVYTLFNLALVLHLHGRVTGTEASAVRALAHYQSILLALKNLPVEALLQCLVLNNLADLHQQLCEYDCASLCLELVADVASQTMCLDAALSEREVKAIALNYALSQFSTSAPVA